MLVQKKFRYVSLGLATALLYLVLVFGMLTALVALCAAYLLTSGLDAKLALRIPRYATKISALAVGVLPFILLGLIGVGAGNYVVGLEDELKGLSAKLVEVLDSWRNLMPDAIAIKFPNEREFKDLAVHSLQARAGDILAIGKKWLVGALQVILGTLVGVLLYVDNKKSINHGMLAREIRARAGLFIQNFRNIVTAQFFIALVNTSFTAIYLYAILPAFKVNMPYAMSLTVLTFVASMLPVVGNLITNLIMTLVSLSAGPMVAVASLVFLIFVHKAEYFINAWAVGGKTSISAWELLVAIFLGEAIFGVAGMVAAPLYYAYVKQELKKFGLV